MVVAKIKRPTNKKRLGHHQKRSQHFHNVYWPYLPLLLVALVGIFLGGSRPNRGTLAYATNLSRGGLLSSTNDYRSRNGKGALNLNDALSSAAQAKANDMASRNYWSHNTPEGQEPWIFIDRAGYDYQKAGENLAFGFSTSEETVIGWMNSQSHRENMLDAGYIDVGFGYANAENYTSTGEQTIVVAMYATPRVAKAPQVANSTPAPSAQPKPAAKQSSPLVTEKADPEPATTQDTPPESTPPPTSETNGSEQKTESKEELATKEEAPAKPKSHQIVRVQILTKGYAPWAITMTAAIASIGTILLLLKHAFAFRRFVYNSEEFILHHPRFDAVLLALILVSLALMETRGVIL